jgi:hypothetical protein
MSNLPSIGLLAGLLCACAATTQGFAADQVAQGPVPNFSSADLPWLSPNSNFLPPPSGPGPITYDKAHPQMGRNLNNRGEVVEAPMHLADLSNPNLKPWVVDSLKKANEELLAGKLRYASRSRCLPGGVPQFLVYGGGFQPLYFIQTPNEVVIINHGDTQVRHVHMNVPHSANPAPSWYGESVGHYEGDELVVDTIGFNEKTFVDDNYNVPHTTQLHVVERFKMSEDGKTLQANFTVEDPGAFNAPWSAIVRYRRAASATQLTEDVCVEQSVEHLGEFFPVPIATKPDF